MSTLGLGNALIDILLKLHDDTPLAEMGIVKGAMDMIGKDQMHIIQQAQAHLEKTRAPGGSVCNTMRAIARLGGRSGFIGKIGSDESGIYYENALCEAGVSPYLVRTDGISGCCTVLISKDGERTMGTFLGPAPNLTGDDIKEEVIARYDYMYIEGYLLVNEPLIRSVMEKAAKQGVGIVLDLSNFNIVNAFRDFLEEIIPRYVNILLANESEAEAFTGSKARTAIRTLSEMVDVSLVTLGGKGSMIAANGEVVHIAAEGGRPVDTTGAGDNFAAGFLYGQAAGATLEQSGRIGSMLAGHVIDVVGAEIPGSRWEQIKLKVADILS